MDEILDAWDGSRLTFEAEYSHDDLRDDRVEVGARLRLPFGGTTTAASAPRLTAQERRMADGLERDTDIVTDTAASQSSKTVSETREDVEDAETDVRFDRVATVGGGGNLTATSSTAGANSLIIANGTHQGAHTLEGDQTLMGGGATIQVRGVDTGIELYFTAAGPAAILSNPGNATNLTLAGDNTHVAGLEIAGSGDALNFGVLVDFGVSNVRIADAHIHDTGRDGIQFGTGSSGGVVSGGVIERAGTIGIHIRQDNTVTITGTTIADAGSDGIYIFSNNTVIITGATIANAGSDGIGLVNNNTVDITDTTIAGAGRDGILITASNNTVTLTDSALAGMFGSNGVEFLGVLSTLAGDGNTAIGATFGPGSGVCKSAVPGGFNGFFEVDGTIYSGFVNCP